MADAELSIERPALYVVATPIGNLADLSARAVAVLSGVDTILCEDTRHSRRLLDHYAISTPLRACHEHNEDRVADDIVKRMQGEHHAYALISDAGTPLISDPGYVLVTRAAAAGIAVLSVPGPAAVTAAMSIAGLPSDRFVFEGFLPAAAGACEARLAAVRRESRTLVYYEAPHRILRTLGLMQTVFGVERQAVVVRELTKRHETVYRGPLGSLLERLDSEAHATRGEFVIVVAGAAMSPEQSDVEQMLDVILPAVDAKTAVRIVAELSGMGRNAVYRRVLARRTGSAVVEKDRRN